jgi:hypothetical protein
MLAMIITLGKLGSCRNGTITPIMDPTKTISWA